LRRASGRRKVRSSRCHQATSDTVDATDVQKCGPGQRRQL